MAIKTRITDLLGLEYPILGGTMMDLAWAPFVAAISNAGALGVIASAIFKDPELLRAEIRKTKDLTDKPFAVNVNLFPMMAPPDNSAFVRVIGEEGVRIVETSGFAAPVELVAQFKEFGLTWIHKCVGVRYAKKVAALGADAVTVVGYENGGATGTLNITTLVLVPATVDAVNIPVVGGGGVMDGRALAAVLALGAEAAIVGTRFMLSEECPIHPNLKAALCEANEQDTEVIMHSVGLPHRIWMNEPAKKVRELEQQQRPFEEIYPFVSGAAGRKMFESGDLTAGTVSCSQGVGMVRKVMPVREIVAEMIEQATAARARLAAFGL